jgi:acetoin utilization protein AcuC
MARSTRGDGPLLVYGPRSTTYDFGPGHPLTPRRFGPGVELLEAVGAKPGLAPEPASDEDLLLVHAATYLATVRRSSAEPDRHPEAGIGPGDTPAFAGMHEAAAAVAGGSLRAIEAILRGDVEHALHPGGGLHHAMAARASGFCVYDDVALAVARARRAGSRVLYVDLDVHHGDGVQAIHAADPGVLTLSIHESGLTLFPGTGFVDELGEGAAAGTVLNLPLVAGTGETAWLRALERILPVVAAAFGPDVVVSQHGADAHAFDPLGHLRVTTTAMGAAARMIDRIAHRWAGGRWLATGGGGYDVYRAVPRAWALTWLAGAHREAPDETPAGWRERWTAEARRFGQAPMPERFTDEPNAGMAITEVQRVADAAAGETVELVRSITVPRLLQEAEARGWWLPFDGTPPDASEREGWRRSAAPAGTSAIVATVTAADLDRWTLAPRVVPPLDPAAGRALLSAALRADPGVVVSAAVAGTALVGVVVSMGDGDGPRSLLHVGVAPGARGVGLASALLAAHVGAPPVADRPLEALLTVGERDPVDPQPIADRRAIAIRLLTRVGFAEVPPPVAIRDADVAAVAFRRP